MNDFAKGLGLVLLASFLILFVLLTPISLIDGRDCSKYSELNSKKVDWRIYGTCYVFEGGAWVTKRHHEYLMQQLAKKAIKNEEDI